MFRRSVGRKTPAPNPAYLAAVLDPNTPDAEFIQNLVLLEESDNTRQYKFSDLCQLAARAATLDFAALKVVENLLMQSFLAQGDSALESIFPQCERILQDALDPKNEAANRDTIGVLVLIYARRASAMSPFSPTVRPEVMKICVAIVQFAQQLLERGATIKPDSSDSNFRFYVAQLYNCTFALTKAVILILNRRQQFFKPQLETVAQILDCFIQIPKLCLRLLPHLQSPDPLVTRGSEDNLKVVNLDPKWPRNPLWRCVDHVLWTMRTLWEHYWRGQLPQDVLKFQNSISSVSVAFSFSPGSRGSKLRNKKGSGATTLKLARQAYAYEALNLLIQVIQFPGLLEDTAEGAYTAVYDLFYHGRHMFGDEFLDARRRFFENVFEKHIVPSMTMPKEMRETIFNTPFEYIKLDAVEVDRAQRVQEAASLAIERLLLDNNSDEALLLDMLKVINVQLIAAAAGDPAKMEAAVTTLSAIFYDSSISNLSSQEIDLIVSMLSKYVLPSLSNRSTDLIVRIRCIDCAGAIVSTLARLKIAPAELAAMCYGAIQAIVKEEQQHPVVNYFALRILSDGSNTLRRLKCVHVLDPTLVTNAALDLYSEVQTEALIYLFKGFLFTKMLSRECVIRMSKLLCANGEVLVKRVVAGDDGESDEDNDDSAYSFLLSIMGVLEDLAYSELGPETAIEVEKIISSDLLIHILTADLFDEPEFTDAISRVVSALTYTLPKPTETLWKFFEPIALSYGQNPGSLEEYVRPLSNFISEGTEAFDAEPKYAGLIWELIEEVLILRQGDHFIDDGAPHIADLIEEFCFNSKRAVGYADRIAQLLARLIRGNRANEQGEEVEDVPRVELGLAAKRSMFRALMNCIRLSPASVLAVLDQVFPKWLEEWQRFYKGLTGSKYRGDKVAAMALAEIVSLPSSSVPDEIKPLIGDLLQHIIAMAENVVEREIQMKKRKLGVQDNIVNPVESSSFERRHAALNALKRQIFDTPIIPAPSTALEPQQSDAKINIATEVKTAEPSPSTAAHTSTPTPAAEVSAFEDPFAIDDDSSEDDFEADDDGDEEDHFENPVPDDEEDDDDIAGAGDDDDEEQDDDGEDDDDDNSDEEEDEEDDDDAERGFDFVDDPNDPDFNEFESEASQGYVSAMDTIDLPLYLETKLKSSEDQYQSLIGLLSDEQYETLTRVLSKASRGPPPLIQLVLQLIADKLESFESFELLNVDTIDALKQTILNRYETSSAELKIEYLNKHLSP